MEASNHVREADKAALSGVILAGGNNRRMGGFHKALLPFQNETLIHRQIRYMKQICGEMILVTNEPKVFLPLVGSDVRIITDYYPGKGPLGGMHAAFSLAQCADIWLVGCDMPFISPRAAKLMLDKKRNINCDAVIPFVDGRLQPLHGVYDKRCSDWNNDIDPRFVLNVNTPAEYEQALRMDETSGNPDDA